MADESNSARPGEVRFNAHAVDVMARAILEALNRAVELGIATYNEPTVKIEYREPTPEEVRGRVLPITASMDRFMESHTATPGCGAMLQDLLEAAAAKALDGLRGVER